MDKIAHYRSQGIVTNPQVEISSLHETDPGWPLWLKAWFFIVSSIALWTGIVLAVFRIF